MPPALNPFVPWHMAHAEARLRAFPADPSEAIEGTLSSPAAAAMTKTPAALANIANLADRLGGTQSKPWVSNPTRAGQEGVIPRVSGLRSSFGEFLFVESQCNLACRVDIDGHLAAISQLAEQQLVRQCAANRVLNEA